MMSRYIYPASESICVCNRAKDTHIDTSQYFILLCSRFYYDSDTFDTPPSSLYGNLEKPKPIVSPMGVSKLSTPHSLRKTQGYEYKE